MTRKKGKKKPERASPRLSAPAAKTSAAPEVEPQARTVLLRIEDTIATITLNRPQRRNAISPRMIEELREAFAECARGPARVVILTGSGSAFSGGMDIGALRSTAQQNERQHLADARRLSELFKSLYTLPRPTIAAINGAAIAGGCGLATLCDFALASPAATFGYPEVHIGFIPATVAVFLVRQVGDRRARELLLSGRVVGAQEAARLGLITEVVAAEKLMLRAYDLAAILARHSPTSLAETKALLEQLPGLDLDRALELAARTSARVRQTQDYREGLSAFLEKRQPVWRSR